MAHRQETTKYGKVRTDEPVQEPEFSLEDILAEYGSSREQMLMEAVEQEAAIAEQNPSAWQEHETDAEALAAQLPEPEPAAPEQEPLPEEPVLSEKPTVTGEKPAPKAEVPAPADLPPPPRPISLEEVVGSTVSAVMEENAIRAETIQKPPRRKLFSRRKLEDTEQLYDTPKKEMEPELEIESIGPEEDPFEAAERYRKEYRSLNGAVLPAFLVALVCGLAVLVMIGVTAALLQRIREIKGGEEDAAAQY